MATTALESHRKYQSASVSRYHYHTNTLLIEAVNECIFIKWSIAESRQWWLRELESEPSRFQSNRSRMRKQGWCTLSYAPVHTVICLTGSAVPKGTTHQVFLSMSVGQIVNVARCTPRHTSERVFSSQFSATGLNNPLPMLECVLQSTSMYIHSNQCYNCTDSVPPSDRSRDSK